MRTRPQRSHSPRPERVYRGPPRLPSGVSSFFLPPRPCLIVSRGRALTMAQEIDPFKLSSPRIFLVRMVVFLTVCALVVVVFYKQIWTAFLANPVVNALIIGVLVFGIALAFQRVIRLFPDIAWEKGSM